MHLSPDEEQAIRKEFDRLANLTSAELEAWLLTPESRRVGIVRRGETESVGRHLAQRPWGDISATRWRWSLMNWGHDPLKDRPAG
jgi:hypothetical protein